MTKRSINLATTNVGLIFSSHPLRRIMNLIDPKALKKYLRVPAFDFWVVVSPFQAICGLIAKRIYSTYFLKTKTEVGLESLFLA